MDEIFRVDTTAYSSTLRQRIYKPV